MVPEEDRQAWPEERAPRAWQGLTARQAWFRRTYCWGAILRKFQKNVNFYQLACNAVKPARSLRSAHRPALPLRLKTLDQIANANRVSLAMPMASDRIRPPRR